MAVRGASYPRQPNEFYRTPAETTRALLDVIDFNKEVYDPCCGDGAILHVLNEYGYVVHGNDLTNGGYNFISDPLPGNCVGCDIVTNPPYGHGGGAAVEFITRALEVTQPWRGRVAMLLNVDFDSGKTRRHLFKDCRAFAMKLVLLNRIRWFGGKSGSINHMWAVWDWTFSGRPHIDYIEQKY